MAKKREWKDSGSGSSQRKEAIWTPKGPDDEPWWEVEKWDRASAESFGMELGEYRRLRQLAAKVPGPDTPNPKNKIWRYLIAKYGFGPDTLRRMTHSEMSLYIEAQLSAPNPRPAVTCAEGQGQGLENALLEWLPRIEGGRARPTLWLRNHPVLAESERHQAGRAHPPAAAAWQTQGGGRMEKSRRLLARVQEGR
jgi:hypothetical protein